MFLFCFLLLFCGEIKLCNTARSPGDRCKPPPQRGLGRLLGQYRRRGTNRSRSTDASCCFWRQLITRPRQAYAASWPLRPAVPLSQYFLDVAGVQRRCRRAEMMMAKPDPLVLPTSHSSRITRRCSQSLKRPAISRRRHPYSAGLSTLVLLLPNVARLYRRRRTHRATFISNRHDNAYSPTQYTTGNMQSLS